MEKTEIEDLNSLRKQVHPSSIEQTIDSSVEGETTSRKKRTIAMHIPYILNGELYKIKSQEGEHVTVKCSNCPPDRLYRGSIRSTGNFHMHIKRRHPDLLGKLHNMKVNALVERRDKLMKSRTKKTRNSSASLQCRFSNLQEFTSTPIHTHNLKIKRVYERHQKQAEEAIKTITPMVNMQKVSTPPTTFMESLLPSGPLDLSTKKNNTLGEQLLTEESAQTSRQVFTALNCVNNMKKVIYPQSIGKSATNGLYERSNLNSNSSITGDDYILISSCERPNIIDLTTTTPKMEMYNNCGVNGNADNCNSKWLELIQHAKSMFLGIQHEIRARNQIEMNRLMLEIAKFKFIHPNFNFQFSEFK